MLVDASGPVEEVADRVLAALKRDELLVVGGATVVGPMTEDWEASGLPRGIVGLLEEPRALAEIAERLEVTDARVLWYLEKLRDAGRVVEEDSAWRRTAAGAELAASLAPDTDGRTELPGPSAQDYVQAYADAAAGMFGSGFVQDSGEHAGRVPGERVAEFHERLQSLIGEYFAPDKIDRAASPKYGFRWVLTPVDLHPLDD